MRHQTFSPGIVMQVIAFLVVELLRLDELSRNDSVEMGSAGRWPAVFGVPPNTSGDTDWKNQTVFLATQPDGRRRVGDDSTRAACSPRSTASLRLNSDGFSAKIPCGSGFQPRPGVAGTFPEHDAAILLP